MSVPFEIQYQQSSICIYTSLSVQYWPWYGQLAGRTQVYTVYFLATLTQVCIFTHNTNSCVYCVQPTTLCTVIIYKSTEKQLKWRMWLNAGCSFSCAEQEWKHWEARYSSFTSHLCGGEDVNKRFQFLHLFVVLIFLFWKSVEVPTAIYRFLFSWDDHGGRQSDRICTKDMGKTPFLSGCPSICPIWGERKDKKIDKMNTFCHVNVLLLGNSLHMLKKSSKFLEHGCKDLPIQAQEH